MDTEKETIEQSQNETDTTEKESFRKYLTQKNVLIAICVLFTIWIVFCDRNSFVRRYQLTKEQNKLIETKQRYQEKIKETQKEIDALNDDEYIERIAREKHLMKKDNEDIYMVTD